jgi:hypothetical protein
VKEESQIDEMRAAIRGDRARAEQARERSTENVRALVGAPAPEVVPTPPVERRNGFLARLFGR